MQQLQQAIIPFHNSALRTVMVGGKVWVAIRPVCEHLGLDAPSQLQKLRQDDDFQLVGYPINSTDGKTYEMMCLPQEQLLGWLYTINSNRVGEAVKPLLKAYRQETTQAINTYWTKGEVKRPQTPQVPQTFADALRLAADLEEQRSVLAQKVQEDAPKVEGYEALMDSTGLLSMKQVAALLDVGDVTLYRWLRRDGYLMDKCKGGKDRHNLPYRRYVDEGLFEVKVTPWERGENSGTASRTWVTSKGLEAIQQLYGVKKAIMVDDNL